MKCIRVLCSICLLVTLFISFVSCNAENIQPYASPLISSRFIASYNLGDGKVKFITDISTVRSVEKLGFLQILIQEYSAGRWVTVNAAYDKYDYNTICHAYTLGYNGQSGHEYRAYVEFYAKDGSISDTKTGTSESFIAD